MKKEDKEDYVWHPYNSKLYEARQERNFALKNLCRYSAVPVITGIAGGALAYFTDNKAVDVIGELTTIISGLVLAKRAFFGIGSGINGISLGNYLAHAIAETREVMSYKRLIKNDPTGEKTVKSECKRLENLCKYGSNY